MSFSNPWVHCRKGGEDLVKREKDPDSAWQIVEIGAELVDSERGSVVVRAYGVKPFILITAPAECSCVGVGVTGAG